MFYVLVACMAPLALHGPVIWKDIQSFVQARAQRKAQAQTAALAPTSLSSATDPCWSSHAKSLVACLDMHHDDHYKNCKHYVDIMRECGNIVS